MEETVTPVHKKTLQERIANWVIVRGLVASSQPIVNSTPLLRKFSASDVISIWEEMARWHFGDSKKKE